MKRTEHTCLHAIFVEYLPDWRIFSIDGRQVLVEVLDAMFDIRDSSMEGGPRDPRRQMPFIRGNRFVFVTTRQNGGKGRIRMLSAVGVDNPPRDFVQLEKD